MARVTTSDSLDDFERFIRAVYGPGDGRFFSVSDILVQLQRFTMRALKGIRKNDRDKVVYNLLIAFAWLPTVADRLNINMQKTVLRRFPGKCSYCGRGPCVCKIQKTKHRRPPDTDKFHPPKTISDTQKMFNLIYPARGRTLEHAVIHLAEETGELSEALLRWNSEHAPTLLKNVEDELADYVSCTFGVANSLPIDLGQELARFFKKNCHECHTLPCSCTFKTIMSFKS